MIAAGGWANDTGALAMDYAQTSVVMLKAEDAFDFFTFCQRNPRPCPILEVLEPGQRRTRYMADGADICNELGRYRVFRDGELVDEPESVEAYWSDDVVTFLLGCSYSFESALVQAGIRLRHLTEDTIPSVYNTSIDLEPAGRFKGKLVVSMRPIRRDQVTRAVQVTSRFPLTHGAPVHIGDPSPLGIEDIERPDACDPPRMQPDEVPVFWACSLTPSEVALASGVPLLINHYPARMFISDRRVQELATL